MDQGSAELNSSNIKGKNPLQTKSSFGYVCSRYGRYQGQGNESQSVPAGIITAPGVNGLLLKEIGITV